jgi:hypothetical protein
VFSQDGVLMKEPDLDADLQDYIMQEYIEESPDLCSCGAVLPDVRSTTWVLVTCPKCSRRYRARFHPGILCPT